MSQRIAAKSAAIISFNASRPLPVTLSENPAPWSMPLIVTSSPKRSIRRFSLMDTAGAPPSGKAWPTGCAGALSAFGRGTGDGRSVGEGSQLFKSMLTREWFGLNSMDKHIQGPSQNEPYASELPRRHSWRFGHCLGSRGSTRSTPGFRRRLFRAHRASLERAWPNRCHPPERQCEGYY